MNRFLLGAVLFSFSVFPVTARAEQETVAAPVPAQQQPLAATASTTPPPETGANFQAMRAEAPSQDTEVTVMKDNYAGAEYVTPSMQNLSKLYWRLGVFNLDDKKSIDNYLIINECDIYRTFYSDDFEWSNVRKTTQDMLKESVSTFPAQFKILVPIDLGRYDMERGGFDVVSGTAFVNSRRVQVTGGGTFTECGQKRDLRGYPSNVVMILNKPFTFNFVKVDEHVAQAFLLRKKYSSPAQLPRELRNKGFQRLAFARMRVTFVRFQGISDLQGGAQQAVLYGRLDGIDVFEDLREEMLLTSINYQ